MMIFVVGCNHRIQQWDEDWLVGDPPDVAELKSHYAALIEEIFTRSEVQFVGEEWGLVEMTVARSAAERHGVPWSDINTSQEEKKQMGIPTDYVDGSYTPEQKAQWHRRREKVMLQKLQEKRGSAENLLVVCGFDHLQPLSELVRVIGPDVEPVDYRKSEWYRPGVLSEGQ